MDEGQLRAFLMISDFHSITKAADELGIAQPSLSQQLLRLEDELGAKLFDRTSRGVTLTAAGQTFRSHADALLQSTRRAREDVRRSIKGVVGDIAFGMPVSLGERMAPQIVRRARDELPGVRLPASRARAFGARRRWTQRRAVSNAHAVLRRRTHVRASTIPWIAATATCAGRSPGSRVDASDAPSRNWPSDRRIS